MPVVRFLDSVSPAGMLTSAYEYPRRVELIESLPKRRPARSAAASYATRNTLWLPKALREESEMERMAQQRAGAERSGTSPLYQVLAEDIAAMGVEAVFGLISDDTALLATALDTSGARFYGARHENCAIAMADGYAYAAGRLGVAVIGRGPALANGLHGAIYASRTGSPVLLIYGEAATVSQPNGLGPDYKAIDGPGVLRAADCARSRPAVHRRRARYSPMPQRLR
jgi:Thiamine pyrophosphate enzyme, N-terminal TPP binding domain